MAQLLPSFVELLASLELESKENSEVQHYALYPTSPSFVSSSPSPSLPFLSCQTSPGKFLTSPGSATSPVFCSPFLVTSHPSPLDNSTISRRKSTSNRYTPYVPPNAFTRRHSLPGDLTDRPDRIHQPHQPFDSSRASSSSPPIRWTSIRNLNPEISTDLNTIRSTIPQADQPISAFVRRRWYPHSSHAQSPKSRKAIRRSISPTEALTPVTLPSLPPVPRMSTGTSSAAPSLSDSRALPSLPSISMLDGSHSTITSDIRSKASYIPKPSSCSNSHDHWISQSPRLTNPH